MKKLSVLLIIGVLLSPLLVVADTLVNINTADLATLETLNGIGPSKGQAIIDYRTQHGPFQKIDDIQNVSGIGPATYAKIQANITVGDTAPASTQTQDQSTASHQTTDTTGTPSTTQTQPPPASQSFTASGQALPAPISARIVAPSHAVAGGGSFFEGQAYTSAGAQVAPSRCLWNFGDGITAEGCKTLHVFGYPGTYVIELTASYNYASAMARVTLSADTASVALHVEQDGSLSVLNLGANDLDASLWTIEQSAKSFTIPEGTTILRQGGVRFAQSILGFSGNTEAKLLYPNGTLAANATVASTPIAVTAPAVAAKTTMVKSQVALAPNKSQTIASSSGEVMGAEIDASSQNGSNSALGWSLGGLVVLIGIGSTAAYLWRPKAAAQAAETEASAEEFELEG